MKDEQKAEALAAEFRTQMQVMRLFNRTRAPLALRQRTAALCVALFQDWQIARYGRVRRRIHPSRLVR